MEQELHATSGVRPASGTSIDNLGVKVIRPVTKTCPIMTRQGHEVYCIENDCALWDEGLIHLGDNHRTEAWPGCSQVPRAYRHI